MDINMIDDWLILLWTDSSDDRVTGLHPPLLDESYLDSEDPYMENLCFLIDDSDCSSSDTDEDEENTEDEVSHYIKDMLDSDMESCTLKETTVLWKVTSTIYKLVVPHNYVNQYIDENWIKLDSDLENYEEFKYMEAVCMDHLLGVGVGRNLLYMAKKYDIMSHLSLTC